MAGQTGTKKVRACWPGAARPRTPRTMSSSSIASKSQAVTWGVLPCSHRAQRESHRGHRTACNSTSTRRSLANPKGTPITTMPGHCPTRASTSTTTTTTTMPTWKCRGGGRIGCRCSQTWRRRASRWPTHWAVDVTTRENGWSKRCAGPSRASSRPL